MSIDKRREILEKTVKEMQKSAEGVVGFYSQIGADVDIETISTGSIAIDSILGGGFVKSKLINLVGHTGSGKSTLSLTACASLQKEKAKNGEKANIMYIDAEQALDPSYASALGVNVDDLIICQPANGEEGFNFAEMFLNSGVADLLIVDSVAAMIPKSMIDRDYNKEPQPGTFAKFIANVIVRLNKLSGQRGVTVILVNQWKPAVKINQYAAVAGAIGNYYQPGGGTFPFYCSQIIEISRKGLVKEGDKVISAVTKISVKKNRIAPPHRTADFYITYGKGLDKTQEIIGLGVQTGFIKNAGSYYSIPGIEEYEYDGRSGKTVQGRQSFSRWLEDHPDICESLEADIRKKVSEARSITVADSHSDAQESDGSSETDYCSSEVKDTAI